jgi:hypothetical protein
VEYAFVFLLFQILPCHPASVCRNDLSIGRFSAPVFWAHL